EPRLPRRPLPQRRGGRLHRRDRVDRIRDLGADRDPLLLESEARGGEGGGRSPRRGGTGSGRSELKISPAGAPRGRGRGRPRRRGEATVARRSGGGRGRGGERSHPPTALR